MHDYYKKELSFLEIIKDYNKYMIHEQYVFDEEDLLKILKNEQVYLNASELKGLLIPISKPIVEYLINDRYGFINCLYLCSNYINVADDINIAEFAVKKNPYTYQFFSEKIRNDKEFILRILTDVNCDIVQYCSENLKYNQELYDKLLSIDDGVYTHRQVLRMLFKNCFNEKS